MYIDLYIINILGNLKFWTKFNVGLVFNVSYKEGFWNRKFEHLLVKE